MKTFGKRLATVLAIAAAGAIATGFFTATPAHAGCSYILTDVAAGEGHYECGGSAPGTGSTVQTRGIDPCYIRQNAMRPCTTRETGVDAKYVGTWEFPTGKGFWVLVVSRDGTYAFHSEAGDNVAANAGSISAHGGHWALGASSGYTDNGSSTFWSSNVWIARGQHGTAVWLRRS